jgi:protoheme IX farnesyltransferase
VTGDLLALTRPKVLMLVLLTAPPALALGHDTWPEISTILGVLCGAALVGGGCSALNAWYERDIDAKMARTRGRPLPDGRLSPAQALEFGLAISAVGLCTLFAVGGWLPATIGLLTLAHYLVVYTAWLKPRSPLSTVVGGVAGAAAPLIADAAVDGQIGLWGLVLFAIIFLWQPPHVWSIALYRKDDYASARFPMMPSTVGDRSTRRRMLAYSLLLIPVTLLPWFAGVLGSTYAAACVLGGAFFVRAILRSMHARTPDADRRTFKASILYLALLFAVMLGELILP